MHVALGFLETQVYFSAQWRSMGSVVVWAFLSILPRLCDRKPQAFQEALSLKICLYVATWLAEA